MKRTIFNLLAFTSLILLFASCGDEEPSKEVPRAIVFNAATSEGGSLQFIVAMDTISMETMEVTYETQDGTATAGSDYVSASETLVFAPGERRKTVEIETLTDDEVEGDETMSLVLLTAVNAKIDSDKALGTIKNVEVVPDYFMTATVGGETWEAKDQFIYELAFHDAYHSIHGASSFISTTNPNVKEILISLNPDIEIEMGTYNIVENKYQGMSATASYDDDGNGIDSRYFMSIPGSGQVEITQLDKEKGTIGGTFSFTVKDDEAEIEISDGEFFLPIK